MRTVRRVLLSLVVCFAVFVAWIFTRGGENETPLRIDVVSEARGVRFLFSYCDGRLRLPVLHLVEVFRPRTDRPNPSECFMLADHPPYSPLQEWRLGAPTSGFLVQGCDSLPPGEYRVTATGPGLVGFATFSLAADGSSAPTSLPCR
jgi:hypothetical protein